MLIIGSYGASNIGDEAILEVLIKNLSQGYELSILSGNAKDTQLRHQNTLRRVQGDTQENKNKNDIIEIAPHFPFGIKSFFSFAWVKSYQLLIKSDLGLLGGGGLFTDDYTLRAPMLWAWHVFWAKVFQKPVILFSNSIGPLNSSLGRFFTKWALAACEKIILRDEISVKSVKELLPSKELTCGTDIVFAYDVKSQNNFANQEWIPAFAGMTEEEVEMTKNNEKRKGSSDNLSSKNSQKTFALNLRDWNMNFNDIPEFLDSLIRQEYKILLIPMEKDDERILRNIQKKVENNASLMMVVPQNYSELIDILKTCEKALGMRLHFLIAAALAGCKISGISYSSKVQGILDKIKTPYILPKDISKLQLEKVFLEAKKAENLEAQEKKVREMFSKI